MIQGVSAGGNVGVVAVTAMRYAQMDGQAVILPVRPAQMINASFKHIQMRPDSRLENGIPLYKLKILDTLIDQLSRKDAAGAGAAGSVDEMIASLSESLRSTGTSYRAGFLPLPGAFVDLLA